MAVLLAQKNKRPQKVQKNRKGARDDNLNAEFAKNGPPEIHEGVARLVNNRVIPRMDQTGHPTTSPKTRKKARTALKSTTSYTVIRTKKIACHLYD